MKVAIGADHRGVRYKNRVKDLLRRLGHEVVDYGADDETSHDYPDYALPVSRAVAGGEADRGILICSTGIGMSIAANKVKGIRAALCLDARMAEAARSHNDSNVLCMGQDFITPENCLAIVEKWLATPFEGGRHSRRIAKLEAASAERPDG